MRKSTLIVGIGDASLETEIFKGLISTGEYGIFVKDISSYAYGCIKKRSQEPASCMQTYTYRALNRSPQRGLETDIG